MMKFPSLIGSKWYHAHSPWLFFSSMAAAAEGAALLPSTQQSASGRWFLHWKVVWMRHRTAFETRSCLTYISHGCFAIFCVIKPYGCRCWGGACCSSASPPSDSQVFLPRTVFFLIGGRTSFWRLACLTYLYVFSLIMHYTALAPLAKGASPKQLSLLLHCSPEIGAFLQPLFF